MEKKFIRFIWNNQDHEFPNKIKALKIITKVFNDKGNFIKIKTPYIKALANQIEIDVDIMRNGKQIYYTEYLPLHHFKHDKGNIIKKSDDEIKKIEADIAKDKERKKIILDQQNAEIENNKAMVRDKTKSDKERLDALLKLSGG